MQINGNRLYRCRCKALYKFFNTDLGVVFDEKSIQDVSINLGWDPNLVSMNSESVDSGVMSFTGSMNTCSITITDPFFTGVTWPALMDVAGAAIGSRSYQSGKADGKSGILRRKCAAGEDPVENDCWDYELIDLENWLPTNNASGQLSTTKDAYKQPAMIMISLWYEAYNGYTFGTDYLFRVSGSSATHGSEFPSVTLSGQGNFGITFQDRLVNVSIDNELDVEKALAELAARNEFNMEFCVADYNDPLKMERKVIKSNLTVKQLLDDIVKNKNGGNYLSLPVKEMYNTLHVCTRADTWPGCSVFYLGKPLYEGFKVTAMVDSSMVGKNYEFGDIVDGQSRADGGSGYLPSLLDTDSAWEVLTPSDKKLMQIKSVKYEKPNLLVNFQNSEETKPIKGSWSGYRDKRDKYFTTHNEKLVLLEKKTDRLLQKKTAEKVNPGWIGEFADGVASVLLSGTVTEVNDMAEGGGKTVAIQTDSVFYLRGMTSKKVSRIPLMAELSVFEADADVKKGYKFGLGGVLGKSLKDKKQSLAYYVYLQNTKEYVEPVAALTMSVPATYDPGVPNVPDSVIETPQNDAGKLITEIAKSLGANPRDLAAIISFETRGSFDPNLMHGTNKDFQGWIGFSRDNRKTYKVAVGQPMSDHAMAVEKYLKDRLKGKSPTLHNMYWAINPNFGNSALDSKLKEGKHWEKADSILKEVPQGDGDDDEDKPAEAAAAPAQSTSQLLKFKWPMTGTALQGWGAGRGHKGLDIQSPGMVNKISAGAPIYASAPGTVTLVKTGCKAVIGGNSCNGGYGNWVEITHGSSGYTTRYAHFDSISVKQGQAVGYDTPLGIEGSTGRSSATHLHFEIRRGGQALVVETCKGMYGKSLTKGGDNCLRQPGDGVMTNTNGLTVSSGGQSNANKGQTAPGGGTGFSVETEFKGVPRALRILPKFTILSFVGRYQEWLHNNKDKEIDPGVWLPDYFRNWLIRTAQFNWTQGDLRVKINASSVFGLDNSGIVPTWDSYSEDLVQQGKYSDYVDYIRAYGDLCWNDNGQPSCHTKCAVTEEFMLSGATPGSRVSSATVSEMGACVLEGGKISLSSQDEDLLIKLALAEAGSEGEIGMALVIRAILNRKLAIEKYNNNYNTNKTDFRSIIYAPNQFEVTWHKINGVTMIDTPRSEAKRAEAKRAISLAFDTERLKKSGISEYLLAAENFRSDKKTPPEWVDNGQSYKNHRFGRGKVLANTKKVTASQLISDFTERYGKCTRTGVTTAPGSTGACKFSTISRKKASSDATWTGPEDTAAIKGLAFSVGHYNTHEGKGATGERAFNLMIYNELISQAKARNIPVVTLPPSQSGPMSIGAVGDWLAQKRKEGYYSFEIHNDANDDTGRTGVVVPAKFPVRTFDKKLAKEFGYFPRPWGGATEKAATIRGSSIIEFYAMFHINKLSEADKKAAAAEAAKRFLNAAYGNGGC